LVWPCGEVPGAEGLIGECFGRVQVCQLRAGFVKDEEEREAMWEQQHELGAQKMYSLCSELGGLFLKVSGGLVGFGAPFCFFCPAPGYGYLQPQSVV
jgi:hypothetical protein